MTIRPDDLEIPERDLVLSDREVIPEVRGAARRARRRQAAQRPPAAPEPPVSPPQESDLEKVLAARLAAVRRLEPGAGLHCRACFQAGRDAALRAITDGR